MLARCRQIHDGAIFHYLLLVVIYLAFISAPMTGLALPLGLGAGSVDAGLALVLVPQPAILALPGLVLIGFGLALLVLSVRLNRVT